MAKRPSAASTRSKQHQVLRYIYSTSFKTASKDYNVSTRKLRQFVRGNPKYLKSRIAKDPAYQSLYKSDVKQVAKKNKEKLIPRLSRKRYFEIEKRLEKGEPVTTRELLAREFRTTTKVREYQRDDSGKVTYRRLSTRQEQMQQSRIRVVEAGYPVYTNISSVKAAFESGNITSGEVRSIVGIWQEEYDFTDDHADDVLEEIMGDYVDEDSEQE